MQLLPIQVRSHEAFQSMFLNFLAYPSKLLMIYPTNSTMGMCTDVIASILLGASIFEVHLDYFFTCVYSDFIYLSVLFVQLHIFLQSKCSSPHVYINIAYATNFCHHMVPFLQIFFIAIRATTNLCSLRFSSTVIWSTLLFFFCRTIPQYCIYTLCDAVIWMAWQKRRRSSKRLLRLLKKLCQTLPIQWNNA